jgi:fused signal recognition particle receptor
MSEERKSGWFGRLFRREPERQEPPPPAVEEQAWQPPEPAPPSEAPAPPPEPEPQPPEPERIEEDPPATAPAPEPEPEHPLEPAPPLPYEPEPAAKPGWVGRLFGREPERHETSAPAEAYDRQPEPVPIDDPGPIREPVERAEPGPAIEPQPAVEEARWAEAETAPAPIEEPAPEPEPAPKTGWLARLRQGLSRSSGALTGNIAGIFTRKKLDDETLEELEEALIMADLGVETSTRMVQRIRDERFGKEVTESEIREALAKQIAEVLEEVAEPLPVRDEARPQVVLVAGVNGVGKTTTIGKLAKQQMLMGRRVMMAACDTFRAAAVEQLEIWGNRNGCPVMKAKTGADAAGLAYDALARAKREDYDLLLIDTAGRLQNKTELMEELAKIVRVIQKLEPEAPHDVLLVLDATTGQNVFNQVDLFNHMVELTGFIVTKLDGSAKGGVVVALAERFGLPVHAVGVGEAIDDLRPFEPDAFARGLLGLDADGRDAA